MALGELVKTLVARFKADGWELVKEQIDSIPDEKTVKVDFDISTASGAKLAGLASLMREVRLGARQDAKAAGEDITLLQAFLAARSRIRAESDMFDLLNGGGNNNRGVFSRLFGSLGGAGGLGPLPAILSSPAALGALVAAAGALATEIVAVASGFAAAGAGVLGFGALAYPTISAITGGLTAIATDTTAYHNATTAAAKSTALAKIKADWAALDPMQKTVVKNVQALQAQFDIMAQKFEPKLMPIFNDLLKIAQNLLPPLQTFANVAAPAITGLLGALAKFTASSGFKDWVSQFSKLTGPSITAIGGGIAQVVIQIGKLLTIFSAKDDARAIRLFFDVIAGAILAVRWAIEGMKISWDWITQKAVPALVHAFDNTKHAWDNVSHVIDNVRQVLDNVGHAIGNFNHAIDNMRHFVAVAATDVWHAFLWLGNQINRFFLVDIPRWITDGVNFFKSLPGKVVSALGSLPGLLFSAGQHIISSLISGLASKLGGLGSIMHTIASVISSFLPNSPAKTGPLSGIGAPEKRGEHIAWALSQGMLSGVPGVFSAAGMLAGAVAGGIPGAAGRYGRGGGYGTINITVNGALDGRQVAIQIQTMLLNLSRSRGFRPDTSHGLGLA